MCVRACITLFSLLLPSRGAGLTWLVNSSGTPRTTTDTFFLSPSQVFLKYYTLSACFKGQSSFLCWFAGSLPTVCELSSGTSAGGGLLGGVSSCDE